MQIAGVLLLIVGVIYPLAALFWLNQRMARQPALAPRQVGLVLAFNGLFPVGLIALGLGLMLPRLASLLSYRVVLAIIGAAALIAWLALARVGQSADVERKDER